MGGIGSGIWSRSRTRTTTDALACVDIRQWEQAGLLEASSSFDKYYPGVRVDVEVDGDHIWFDIRQRGREARSVVVELSETSCNFGGVRRWFVCPRPGCRRRAGVLYIAEGLACRKCLQLVYESQREDGSLRARRRVRKAHAKLDNDGSIQAPVPPKPPHMRWSTYETVVRSMASDSVQWLEGSRRRLHVAVILANRVERDIAIFRLRQQTLSARSNRRLRAAQGKALSQVGTSAADASPVRVGRDVIQP